MGGICRCSYMQKVYLANIIHFIYILTAATLTRPVWTGHELVWTVTGSDRSCNRQKPTKTAMNRSMTVRSGFFQVFRISRPVLVLVLSDLDKRPDRTGLPSTTCAQQAWTKYLTISPGSLVVMPLNSGSLVGRNESPALRTWASSKSTPILKRVPSLESHFKQSFWLVRACVRCCNSSKIALY